VGKFFELGVLAGGARAAISSVLVDVERGDGGGDGAEADGVSEVVVADVVVLDVECFGRVETVGLSDGELARGCRWVACCAGVECSWWAAGWGWGEKVGANVEQVDAVKLGVVDDGDAAIDVSGDDGVGVGTGGIVLDTKAFGFHVALCEEGVFESGTPEGHGHGGWK